MPLILAMATTCSKSSGSKRATLCLIVNCFHTDFYQNALLFTYSVTSSLFLNKQSTRTTSTTFNTRTCYNDINALVQFQHTTSLPSQSNSTVLVLLHYIPIHQVHDEHQNLTRTTILTLFSSTLYSTKNNVCIKLHKFLCIVNNTPEHFGY